MSYPYFRWNGLQPEACGPATTAVALLQRRRQLTPHLLNTEVRRTTCYMSQLPPVLPHGTMRYKLVIVVLLIAVVVLGVGLGLAIMPNPIFKTSSAPSGFTFVHGAVTVSSSLNPKTIEFRPTATDTLSAAISSGGNFQITLHTSVLYSVSVHGPVSPDTGNLICNTNPSTIIPSGSDYTQNFTC